MQVRSRCAAGEQNGALIAMSQSSNSPPPAAPKTPTELFAVLEDLGIKTETVSHRAVFTVEEGRDLKRQMPGGHSKNLFLKDKKGALHLAVAHADTRVDLVGLGKALGAKGRFSFGKPDLMTETLGVIPGAVTPFALVNQSARALAGVVLDGALMACDPVWFHPLENTASTAISPENLLVFLKASGFSPKIMDLAAPTPG